ncbi:16518_t:CDS:2, partial [Rhizophagus irregularis]
AYRKGKALCGLKHYKDATNILQNLYQRMKGNTSIKQILEHTEMLSYENKNGKYDYLRIVDEFYERSKIKKDNKVDLVEGKGRGWIAKCDIPECTLLMVSKAFKVVFSNEAFGTMITNNKGACSCAEELTTCITRKLFEEPYY